MAAPEQGGWRLADARNKIDEIIDASLNSAPQIIHVEHKGDVVVASRRAYDALLEAVGKAQNEQEITADIKEYLLKAGRGPQEDPLDDYTDG